MSESTKKWMCILSILPFLAFSAWTAYLLMVNHRLIKGSEFQEHDKVVTLISNNYNGLLVLLAIAFILAAIVLITFTIHIKKLATMNGSTKLAWIIFMLCFGAVAFPVVWYLEMRHEPFDVPRYDSIEHGVV